MILSLKGIKQIPNTVRVKMIISREKIKEFTGADVGGIHQVETKGNSIPGEQNHPHECSALWKQKVGLENGEVPGNLQH